MSREIITDASDILHRLPPGESFAVDVETTGLNWREDRIVGVALTFACGESFYIALEHTVGHIRGMGEEEERDYLPQQFIDRDDAFDKLQPLFAQKDVLKIAHNAKFDQHFLVRAGAPLRGILHDTMLAAQLVDENRSVSLKALAPLVGMDLTPFQGLEHYPGFAKHEFLGVPLAQAADYAMADTEATWALWGLLEPQMRQEGVYEAYRDVWLPLLPVLRQMEARGIALDMPRVHALREQFTERAHTAHTAIWQEGVGMVLDRLEKATTSGQEWVEVLGAPNLKPAHELGIEVEERDEVLYGGIRVPVLRKKTKAFKPRIPWFNPASSPQMKELLFDHHKLKLPRDIEFKTNKDGDVGVDRDTLTVLKLELGEKAPPILSTVLEYRKAQKLVSTYLDTFAQVPMDTEGCFSIHTSFNQAATDTGRLSSSGPNLQNIPARNAEGKLVRELFVARPGYTLVVADYAMMELRMAAHFSEDWRMLQAFEEGLDLHTLTASQQQQMTYEDLAAQVAAGDPQAKQHRQIGKTSNFGLLYGMGARKFQRYLLVENGLKVGEDQASRLIEDFDQTYAGVTAWKQRLIRDAHRFQYVTTLAGRKRRLPDISHPDDIGLIRRAERQAVNAVVQGSCADIISGCMPAIQRALRKLGGSLLLQVHDELVAEVPEKEGPYAVEIMEALMVDANHALRCPLVVEAHIGQSWGAAK
jgi:DNA polymerase-1